MNKEKIAILKSRAATLAEDTLQKAITSEGVEVISFSLGDEIYCIESGFVREVYPLKDFTTLPGVPSHIYCIINVRGQILPVIDLKNLFNLPERGFGELNKVVILQNELMEFGVLADEIRGTETIELTDLQPVPTTLSAIRADYLKGVTGEGLIFINTERLLNDKKIIVNQEVI